MKYEKEIREIISDTIDSDTPIMDTGINMKLSEAGMDSIAFVEIIIAIEERFGIEVPNDALAIEENDTIANLCGLVSSLTENGESI